jgi:WS/DGAT/MGAT family acyltransferase
VAGATVNDVVLALVAGALRRWLDHRHGETGPIRVQVPVSMHRPGDAAANRDSYFNVDLPVDEPDPVRRLERINAETGDRKAHHDADELFALFTELSHVSRPLYRAAYRAASDPRVFALSVSNVRGPEGPRYLAGGRIRELYGLAKIAPRHALRVSAWSFSGRMSFGLCADADAVADLDVLARGLEASLDELLAHV